MDEKKNKSAAKKIISILKRTEIKFLALFIGLFLLSWPYMASLNNQPLTFPFIYYYAVWVVLATLLVLSNIFSKDDDEKHN
jgi:hypothetical protein